jgi:hypothetical protein
MRKRRKNAESIDAVFDLIVLPAVLLGGLYLAVRKPRAAVA